MKTCPKCQTTNQESSNFCKKCGVKISGSQFQGKKEQILGGKKLVSSFTIISALAVIALGGIAYWMIDGSTPANSEVPSVAPRVMAAANVDTTGQKISMVDIQAGAKNGRITLPMDLVLEKRFVRFEYDAGGNKIPLLAYVTSSGKVITAVSMCEPCRSTRFHIQDKTLVCNACYTKWTLDTLKGISGGCLKYPPDVIPHTIEKGIIQIDEKKVTEWKPRV